MLVAAPGRVAWALAALLGWSAMLGTFAMTTAAAGGGSALPKTQTVSFSSSAPASEVVGATYLPKAVASSGLTPVTFVIDGASTPGACTQRGASGALLFHNVPGGKCIIDAVQAGNASYLPSFLLAIPSETISVARPKR
jgi:hypothetical protein